jgi:hypothetical protein
VLDDQEGLPVGVQLPDDLRHAVDQHRVDATGRLVEQDQPRVEHQDLGELHELLLTEGERCCLLVPEGPHPDVLQELVGRSGLRSADSDPRQLPPGEGALGGHDVLQDGHLAEQPGDLEGAPQPAVRAGPRRQPVDPLAGEPDLTAVGMDGVVDQVEQCGLARAVGADQPGDRALRYDE